MKLLEQHPAQPAPELRDNTAGVERAFSLQAPVFDAQQENNPVLRWMRSRVYNQTEKYLKEKAAILELNGGTGIDAIHFASRGHSVLVTDQSGGMTDMVRKKISGNGFAGNISIRRISFTELEKLPAGEYDHIFSNFGGLNCIPDLRMVVPGIRKFLKPDGYVTLAIMPPVCPWELLYLLRGRGQTAVRRLKPHGTPSFIEGLPFLSWYFTPSDVRKAFGEPFELVELSGIASVVPPPYMTGFQRRFPGLLSLLMVLDEKLSRIPPFNRWADYFVITLRFRGIPASD